MDKTVSLLLFTFIHFYQTSFVTNEENVQRVRKFRRDESLSSLIEMSTVLVRDKMACFAVCLALRSLVVRALERYSKDPGSSPGGDTCFSH